MPVRCAPQSLNAGRLQGVGRSIPNAMAAKRRSTSRPTRRARRRSTLRRSINLPGGFKLNINEKSISFSGRNGPLSGTYNPTTGSKSASFKLPGGFSIRKSG